MIAAHQHFSSHYPGFCRSAGLESGLCTPCMACSLRRLLPVSACMLHIACGAVPINKQCSAPSHPPARTVHRTSSRGRSARATSAAMKPIVIAPQAPHTGTVIMLHGLGDTGAG